MVLQISVSPTLLCNHIGAGLTVTNVMNRKTTTTGNGNIINGRIGLGGGKSFSSSGGWEYHRGGGKDRNYENGGIHVRRKRVFRGGTRGGGRGIQRQPHLPPIPG